MVTVMGPMLKAEPLTAQQGGWAMFGQDHYDMGRYSTCQQQRAGVK